MNKAAALARAYGVSDRMRAVIADGLSPLNDEPGPYKIAVCGMGGKLIARLLKEGAGEASRAELIVMQPMRGEAERLGEALGQKLADTLKGEQKV